MNFSCVNLIRNKIKRTTRPLVDVKSLPSQVYKLQEIWQFKRIIKTNPTQSIMLGKFAVAATFAVAAFA